MIARDSGPADLLEGGVFVAVVGSSGAGKDAIIEFARQRLTGMPHYHFVRRVVTRSAVEGAEDHDSISEEAFSEAVESHAFCLHWRAHGLRYGLPQSVNEAILSRSVVIANLSRTVLPKLHHTYRHVTEVHVTASDAVLAHRLASRGRETEHAIKLRLERAAQCDPPGAHATVLDNSGPLAIAGAQFVQLLEDALNKT